ncbi:MAG TPA: PmoA family protein [Cyclobacteriaceae bacterium]|nr:PmoA family protein [Cyclobacteriaceae bacterium]
MNEWMSRVASLTGYGIGVLVMVVLVISAATAIAQQKEVKFVTDEKGKKVDVLIGGKLFTSYIYPDDLDKPVLYPVYTAKGTVITRGFPRDPRPGERVDHPHHVGIWFNYGDVNGLDFWNNSYAIPADKKDQFGSIRHQKVVKAENGKDEGKLSVIANWVDSKGNVLLVEETTFVFRGTDNLRTIDRTTRLTAQQSKVIFKDNKEGMMGIRLDRAFEEPATKAEVFTDASGNPTSVPVLNNEGVNGVYRNSAGLEKGDVWGKRADWVSLSAKKNGEPITVAMIDNKKNIGYPAHWHARTYGLFAVNSIGSKVYVPTDEETMYTLDPGKSLVFKYRILVNSGGFLDDNAMNQEFKDFNK